MMINSIIVIDKWLYCWGDSGLVRMNFDGSMCETIMDMSGFKILYNDGYLFCPVNDTFDDIRSIDSSKKGIWKIDINTLETKKVYEELKN